VTGVIAALLVTRLLEVKAKNRPTRRAVMTGTAQRIIDRHVIMHGVGMPADDVPAARSAAARDIADALQECRRASVDQFSRRHQRGAHSRW
jgi:hypothetical protein